MDKNDIKIRTKQFALAVAKLCISLPVSPVNKAYINQLIRCSSSVGANYRAACRGKSKADFIHKLRIVEEELDESLYFIELLAEFNQPFVTDLRSLFKEGDELLAIIVSSINTALKNSIKVGRNDATNLKPTI